MNASGGAAGVGRAVNEAVVIAFLGVVRLQLRLHPDPARHPSRAAGAEVGRSLPQPGSIPGGGGVARRLREIAALGAEQVGVVAAELPEEVVEHRRLDPGRPGDLPERGARRRTHLVAGARDGRGRSAARAASGRCRRTPPSSRGRGPPASRAGRRSSRTGTTSSPAGRRRPRSGARSSSSPPAPPRRPSQAASSASASPPWSRSNPAARSRHSAARRSGSATVSPPIRNSSATRSGVTSRRPAAVSRPRPAPRRLSPTAQSSALPSNGPFPPTRYRPR